MNSVSHSSDFHGKIVLWSKGGHMRVTPVPQEDTHVLNYKFSTCLGGPTDPKIKPINYYFANGQAINCSSKHVSLYSQTSSEKFLCKVDGKIWQLTQILRISDFSIKNGDICITQTLWIMNRFRPWNRKIVITRGYRWLKWSIIFWPWQDYRRHKLTVAEVVYKRLAQNQASHQPRIGGRFVKLLPLAEELLILMASGGRRNVIFF